MTYPLPRTLTTEQAAGRLWTIRMLMRERAIDLLAADVALGPLRASGNPRIAALAARTTSDIYDRAFVTGAFAR